MSSLGTERRPDPELSDKQEHDMQMDRFIRGGAMALGHTARHLLPMPSSQEQRALDEFDRGKDRLNERGRQGGPCFCGNRVDGDHLI